MPTEQDDKSEFSAQPTAESLRREARTQVEKLREDLKKELRQMVKDELDEFLRDARQSIAGAARAQRSGESLGEEFRDRLFSDTRRQWANSLTQAVLDEFLPSIAEAGRSRPSRTQVAAELLRMLNLGQRLF